MKDVLKKLGVGQDQILNKEHLLGLKGGSGSCNGTVLDCPVIPDCLNILYSACYGPGHGFPSTEECIASINANCTLMSDGNYCCEA